MAEQLHDHARVHAFREQQGRCGVAAVVKTYMADPSSLQQRAPVVVVGLLVDGPSVGLGEDEVLVLPVVACQHSLAELSRLVLLESRDQRHGQSQRALAAFGLGGLVDQSAAFDAVDRATHRQAVVERIDVLPLQCERLGLA
ncbi:hypothetical protein [Jatrophihabitans sp.]|uniref:hypothetical protein n=1 Tax=Jatrophihabitans sp. TaxID=1932789 RepID=UPI0030C746C6